MPPALDAQPLSLVLRVGGPSRPAVGRRAGLLGESSEQPGQPGPGVFFTSSLLGLQIPACVHVCVRVCLSVCLSLPLHVFVSFCLVLSARMPLSCPAPLYSHGGSPTLPPSQLCVITSIIPGLCRTDASQAPTRPSFPLFAQLWQHTSSCPALWRCPRQCPKIPPLGGCALCVWWAPSHARGAGTVPSPRTRHADHSGWSPICWLRDLPPRLPLRAILGMWATGHKLEQGRRRGPASTHRGGWKPGVSLQH